MTEEPVPSCVTRSTVWLCAEWRRKHILFYKEHSETAQNEEADTSCTTKSIVRLRRMKKQSHPALWRAQWDCAEWRIIHILRCREHSETAQHEEADVLRCREHSENAQNEEADVLRCREHSENAQNEEADILRCREQSDTAQNEERNILPYRGHSETAQNGNGNKCLSVLLIFTLSWIRHWLSRSVFNKFELFSPLVKWWKGRPDPLTLLGVICYYFQASEERDKMKALHIARGVHFTYW